MSGSHVHTHFMYRYRPSSSKSQAVGQSSPAGPAQMYAYNNYTFHRQQPPPPTQHMSRPSPPHSTWAVPQTHNPYYAEPRGPTAPAREEHAHLFTRSDINPAGSTSFNNANLSSGMASSAEYFPNVIDTSMFRLIIVGVQANIERSLGCKGV